MPASEKSVKAKNLCVASEIGKSGRPVTVSMIDPLITSTNQFGWQLVTCHELPPKNLKSPALVIGSMLPALFKADGFDFDVQFRVTGLKVSTKQSRFAVTDIHLNGIAADRVVSVDSSIVYPQMLLRLAIRASAVTGIAYPAGWTIDSITGEYLTTLKVGDEQPIDSVAYGVETKASDRLKRVSSRDPARSGEYRPRVVTKLTDPARVAISRSFSGNPNLPPSRRPLISQLTEEAVLLHKIGREIDHAELNDLIGKVQKPKASSDSMSNPKVQQLVAKLYALPVPAEYTSQVEYVRSELTKHGIYKSESWVRQTKRKATKSTKRKLVK